MRRVPSQQMSPTEGSASCGGFHLNRCHLQKGQYYVESSISTDVTYRRVSIMWRVPSQQMSPTEGSVSCGKDSSISTDVTYRRVSIMWKWEFHLNGCPLQKGHHSIEMRVPSQQIAPTQGSSLCRNESSISTDCTYTRISIMWKSNICCRVVLSLHSKTVMLEGKFTHELVIFLFHRVTSQDRCLKKDLATSLLFSSFRVTLQDRCLEKGLPLSETTTRQKCLKRDISTSLSFSSFCLSEMTELFEERLTYKFVTFLFQRVTQQNRCLRRDLPLQTVTQQDRCLRNDLPLQTVTLQDVFQERLTSFTQWHCKTDDWGETYLFHTVTLQDRCLRRDLPLSHSDCTRWCLRRDLPLQTVTLQDRC